MRILKSPHLAQICGHLGIVRHTKCHDLQLGCLIYIQFTQTYKETTAMSKPEPNKSQNNVKIFTHLQVQSLRFLATVANLA